MSTGHLISILLLYAVLPGCVKEGAEGPQGPTGAGGGLIMHAEYFVFPPQNAWSGTGSTSYRTTLSAPSITEEILMNGFVRVHWYELNSGDTLFAILPHSVYDPLPIVTYSHTDTIGSVTIATSIPGGFHINPGGVFPGEQYGFRVATIR